ncbi:MAG: hypothetical protein IKB90_04930 [Alistipes sp.]|nr:hypothetical protein [Alistipes sp.]
MQGLSMEHRARYLSTN